MRNRLRKLLRTLTCVVGFFIYFAAPSCLLAQPGFFTFSYNGPDTFSVGISCSIALQGNMPNPVVGSTIGANIITSMFSADSSNFTLLDTWTAGETAHVYWFVEDDMGHAHYFDFFLFFVDSSPPTFDLTGVSDTLFFNSIVEVPAAPVIPIIDNCGPFTQTFVETMPPDTCEAGQFTRTWTATDEEGNVGTFTQWVIISADTAPPTIIFGPQNGSSPCETLSTTYPAWLAAQMAAFTADDPSGIKSLTNNAPATFPSGCTIPLTVTFKATDNCNFMIPTTATFSTSDTEGPVVLVEPKDTIGYCSPGNNHLNKLNEWISTHAYMQVIDSCSGPLTFMMEMNGTPIDSAGIVAAFWASFDNPCGTQLINNQLVNKVSAYVEVFFSVKDACNNLTLVGSAKFGAVDTLPPVISGAGISEQCGGGNDQSALNNWINAKANATLTDDCSIPFWTNFSYTTSTNVTGSGAFDFGPYPTLLANTCNWFVDVTFNASDECGNNSSRTHRFQIIDTQAPQITDLAPNITVFCPNPLPTVPDAILTDNCDANISTSFTRIYQDSICDGSYTVVTTWQASDDCGNTTTAIQNIFVRDTTRPVFTLVPVGLLMRCDTFVLPPVPVQGQNINATDLCSPVISINTSTVSTQNPDPTHCQHYSYHYTRTFTATDECGNTQTATQIISVIDNQPPVPGGVLDTTALCSVLTPFPAPVPLAMDLCGGMTPPPVPLDTIIIPGVCAGNYTIQKVWQARDFCFNSVVFNQFIHVIDTVAPQLSNIPPGITVECDGIPIPPDTNGFNGTDNCAAGVTVTLTESEIRNPDTTNCSHWNNYIVRREWTASDDCGNLRTYSQDIMVVDITPPAMVAPPAIVLPNDPGDCGVSIPLPAPISIFDKCTSGRASALVKDTMAITPLTPPFSGTIPVDTIVFQVAPPNSLPAEPAISNVTAIVFIEKADADGVTEYFRFFGENSFFLGNTGPTPGLCSSIPGIDTFTFSAAQFNSWAADGSLTFTFAPNGSFGAAINPTCTDSRIRLHLIYDYATPSVPVELTYSLDGAAPANFPPPGDTYLPVGTHTLVYTASDCAENSSTASVQITVNDVEAPSIAAPAPIVSYVSNGACMDTIVLPFPVITENCKMSGNINKSSIFNQIQFIDDPDFGNIPASVTMNIPGLIPNAITGGTLSFKFKGDNSNPREFFNIFHGITPVISTNINASHAGSCLDTVLTSLPITPAQINLWAANGNAVFRAEPNTFPAGVPLDFDFINPCGGLLPGSSWDGVSIIQAMIEYNYAIINFKITRNSPSMIVATGAVQGTQTMVPNLSPGAYTIEYTTTDQAGLIGTTTFPLTVLDTIKPVAKCKPQLFIEINPSGLNNYVLQPFEINNNSTDNCPGTLSYSLSQSVFTCQAAGTSNQVVLTVTDAAGNISTCSTTVFAQMDAPAPSNSAVCEGDTLFLLANPPTPGNFLYNWTGPAFTSTIQNPIRPNALPSYQGQYTVQITGSTGCTASGSVTVNFANLSQPIFSVSGGNGTNFCQGQSVTLNASFSMGNVSYLWYQVGSPADILLGTTSLNFFTLPNLAPGQYSFYVKVKVGDCLTPNSLAIVVNVFARPTASVVDNFIQICAGQPLGLSTNETGVSYYWEGPLGWTSTVQHPLVMAAVTEMEEGFYTLTTTQNGCASIPVAIVQVDVKYTPPKPIITGDGLVCSGQDVLLTANVASQFFPLQYLWQDFPSVPVPTGQINTLQLNDITPADCGFWRVRATYENCPSEWSDEAEVCAENYPDVTAASNSPICQDSMLNLMATGSSGIVEWSWILPDNSIIYTQNPSITPGQPGIYRAVVKTLYECTDTATIIVAGSIAPIISNLEVIAPICENGSPAILIPTISSLNSPFTYFWTHNGTTLSFPSPTYVIAPYGPANNGAYTLVVKDSLGCPSIPQTTLLNVQAYVPTPQIVITDNFVCVGETVELKLDSVYNGSPTFYWIGPQNDTTVTTSAQLFLNNIQLSQEGNYTVFVQVGDCFSSNSIFATLTVNPIPAVPSIGNIEPVCSGDDLHLFVDPELPGTNYHWTGPGYNVTAISPVRTNMTEAQEGNYFVQAEQAGCFSGKDTAFVFVMALPKNPLILTTDPSQICIEPINPNAFIRVSLSTQTINGLYTWINPASGDTLWGPSSDFTLNFIDLAPQFQLPGLHQFSVLTWLPDNAAGSGCSSMVSPSFSVQFDTVPNNQALCADDHKACSAKPILLEATDPSGTLTGMWNQIGAPLVLITNPDSSTARFNGVAGTTYTFVWSISNGGCVNFSSDTIQIMVAPPEQSFAGADTAICDGSNFMLNAKDGVNVPGIWSQLNQFVTIVDSLESKTPITGLIPGMTYYFVWTLGDIGCGLSIDTVEVRYYSQKPDIDWINNEALCSSSNQVFLNIKDALANFEFGKWSKIPGTPLEFQNPNSTQTEVYELTPGLNTVYFTINDGVCGNNSRDTAVINYQIIPLANNDFANVDFGGSVSINVLTNDALPPNGTPISVYILPPGPLHGEIIDTFEIGSFVYKPDAGYSGSDEFSYRVCNNICGTDNCPTATVSINVGAAGNCFVPTIITPNNDGLNDFFQLPPECYISGEGQLGAVEVTVFNQWGDYVFHSLSTEEPSGIIVWDGKYNGKQLPASTYYYIVKFEGDQTPKSGFLLIQY